MHYRKTTFSPLCAQLPVGSGASRPPQVLALPSRVGRVVLDPRAARHVGRQHGVGVMRHRARRCGRLEAEHGVLLEGVGADGLEQLKRAEQHPDAHLRPAPLEVTT